MSKEILARRWMYANGSKEQAISEISDMEEDGLLDDMTDDELEKFESNFVYALYEVGLELEIYKDGSYKILNVKE
jgi:hypothetical protein